MEILEFMATILSIAGAVCMASKTKYSFVAYCLWPLASAIWGYLAIQSSMYGLAFTMALHCSIETYGFYRWIANPRKDLNEALKEME